MDIRERVLLVLAFYIKNKVLFMIIKDRNTKDLVIPKSLGNFGGGSEWGGVTPEEVEQIASAITENAIDEYDTELQVDLEDMKEAISGNTQSIEELSGLTDDVAAVSAKTEENAQSIEDLSGATSAITESIGVLSAATSANTEAIEALSGVTDEIAALSAQTSANTEAIEALSGVSDDIAALSAQTSANTANIEALSAQTSANTAAIQEMSGKTGDYVVVDQLSDIADPYEGMMAYAKYKTLNGWAINGSSISEGYVAQVHYDGTAGNKTPIYRSGTDFYWNWDNSKTGWTQDQNIWYKIDRENAIFYAACEDPNAYIELSEGVTTASTSTQVDVNKLFMYDGTEWNEFGGGGSAGYREFFINNMTNAERAELYNEIRVLLGAASDSANLPQLFSGYRFYVKYDIDGQRWCESFFSNFEGQDIWLIGCKPPKLSYPFEMFRIGAILHPDGSVDYTADNAYVPQIPNFVSVAFGNSDIGGLSYNTSTGLFTLGGVDYASGDTTTPVQDVYDYNFVINGLLTRTGDFDDGSGNIYKLFNAHTLTITDNGEDITLTSPSISMRGITSYTVDDIEFNRELTFNYGGFKLIMDVAESNVGINLRVQ